MGYSYPPEPPGYIEIQFLDEKREPVRHYFRDIRSWRTTDYEDKPMSELEIVVDENMVLRYPREHILSWRVLRNGHEFIDELRAYRLTLHEQGHPERGNPDHPANGVSQYGSHCRYCEAEAKLNAAVETTGGERESMSYPTPTWSEIMMPEVNLEKRARNSWSRLIDTILGRD